MARKRKKKDEYPNYVALFIKVIFNILFYLITFFVAVIIYKGRRL